MANHLQIVKRARALIAVSGIGVVDTGRKMPKVLTCSATQLLR